MTDRNPLSHDAVADALTGLPGWSRRDDRLVKTFEFGSFREAMGFITRIAFEAEDMNHHPELTSVYNRVDVSLSTHDAGDRITGLDTELAGRIERISWV